MNQFELSNKVAIVTGGGGTSHGIGAAVAITLAKAGARVVVVGRNRNSLDKVVKMIKGMGRDAVSIVADVTDPSQVDRLILQASDVFGSIDILVNNAGEISFGNPEDLSYQEWCDCMSLNLNGTFLCSVAASREMIKQGGGKIVNIGSSSGIKGEENAAHFAASKAAVINLTRSLAISWSVHNINVNCVSPGSIEVPEQGVPGMPEEEKNRRQQLQSAEVNSLALPGKPQDIANAVVFFASPGSDIMTGENLVVRGSEWASAYA